MKAVSAQAESYCVYVVPKIMQHIIPDMFDGWTNPVFHLLRLKSSIDMHLMSHLASRILGSAVVASS